MNKISKVLFAAPLLSLLASTSVFASHNHNNVDMQKRMTQENMIGTWGFTTMQTCSRSKPEAPGSVSIDPVTRAFNTNVDIVGMAGSGNFVFNRDGTMSLETAAAGELDQSKVLVGNTPVSDGFFPTCKGVFNIVGKNQFSVEFNCVIDVPSKGIVIHAGPVKANGFVSSWGDSLTINLEQNVQTMTLLKSGNSFLQYQRVCLQNFNAHKVSRH